jgi:endonuclease-3
MWESLEQKRERVRKIIARLKRTHPDARLMLKFSTPLELLVALILSARTRDEVVNAITPELFRRYRTAADWANEKPEVLYKRLRRKTANALLGNAFGSRRLPWTLT